MCSRLLCVCTQKTPGTFTHLAQPTVPTPQQQPRFSAAPADPSAAGIARWVRGWRRITRRRAPPVDGLTITKEIGQLLRSSARSSLYAYESAAAQQQQAQGLCLSRLGKRRASRLFPKRKLTMGGKNEETEE